MLPMYDTTELRSRLNQRKASQYSVTPHRPISQGRATRAAGLDAVRTSEALVGRDVALIQEDEKQGDAAHL